MRTVVLFFAILVSAAGFYVSDKLLAKHMKDPGAPAWINSLCESSGASNVSCDQVLNSPWGRIGSLPVAFIGMAYFTVLLTWFIAIGRSNRAGRRRHLVPLLINVLGVCGSIGFIFIMGTQLKMWCPMCVITHGLNIVLLVLNVLLWPKRSPQPVMDAEGTAPATIAETAYPSWRLAVVVVAGAVVLSLLEQQMVFVKGLARTNSQLSSVVEEVQKSVDMLVAMHLNSQFHEIPYRSDDAARTTTGKGPILVVWADFECEHCKKFERDFEDKYRKMFGDYVQLVFRHYPLCSDCNPNSALCVHPHSCKSAAIAEAVRVVGGNAKFWAAHDLLFDLQKELSDVDARSIATKLELDPDKVAEAAASEAVRQRIAEDVAAGHAVGVKSTPGVYLNGKEVSSLSRGIDGFWQKMGFAYHTKVMEQLKQQQGTPSDQPAPKTE